MTTDITDKLAEALYTFDEAMRNGSIGPEADKQKAGALKAARRKAFKALALYDQHKAAMAAQCIQTTPVSIFSEPDAYKPASSTDAKKIASAFNSPEGVGTNDCKPGYDEKAEIQNYKAMVAEMRKPKIASRTDAREVEAERSALISDLKAAADNGENNKGLDTYMINAIKKAIAALATRPAPAKSSVEAIEGLKQSTGNIEDDHSVNRTVKSGVSIVKAHRQEWQPIEAAPHDGTVVVLWVNDEPIKGLWERENRQCMLAGVGGGNGYFGPGWVDEQNHLVITGSPTHWMLPPLTAMQTGG